MYKKHIFWFKIASLSNLIWDWNEDNNDYDDDTAAVADGKDDDDWDKARRHDICHLHH